MTNPTVDDLQSMFPQLPLTAIHDIVEQSGGCDKAMEVLLTVSDNQRGSLQHVPFSSIASPLVSSELVSTHGSKQRMAPRVELPHSVRQLSPGGCWPHHFGSDFQVIRSGSPHNSARKKERHSGSAALGVLGMLTNLHDDKVGRSCGVRDKRSPSPISKNRSVQQFLLPWQQTANQHACKPCAFGHKDSGAVGYPSQHEIVAPASESNHFASPIKPDLLLPLSRVGSPEATECVSWPTPALTSHLVCEDSSGSCQVYDDVVAPSTPPGQSRPPPSAALPDEPQKIAFLAGMFKDMQLSHEALCHMLSAANGDIELAVNKILEVQTLIDASADGASLSEENSSLGDDSTPEARMERSISCLKALHENFDEAELEGVLEAVGGDVDVAIEVLTDMERQEAQRLEQLRKDEELARMLHSQQEQAAAQAVADALPVPIPIRVPSPTPSPRAPKSPPPAHMPASRPLPQQRSRGQHQAAAGSSSASASYAWEQQNEALMLSCRVKLLQRMFACPVERDLAEAMLLDSNQDVQQASEKLVEAGLPLKASKGEGVRAERVAGGAEDLSDEELRRLKIERPDVARGLIHDRTQAMYESTRKRGHEYMALKKACLERATQCFNRGQNQEAEALKQEAQRYGQLADEEHRKAGNKLFNTRNNTLMNTWTLDLHALHIHEALEKLDEHFYLFNQLPSQKVIKIVTGRGAHSPDNVPKLYLAVRDRLIELDYSFEGHLGWFMVYLDAPGQAAAAGAISTAPAGSQGPTPSRPARPHPPSSG